MKISVFATLLTVALTFLSVYGGSMIKSCFFKDKTFPTSGLTHVDTHMVTAEECQMSCKDEDCLGFTWINTNSPFLPKICALFNSTETQIDCENCVSGPKECPCHFHGECNMTSANFVDLHHHVVDVASCHDLCAIFDGENCEYFTYFNDQSEFPHLCFLFNDCGQNNTDCSGCIHGPKECTFCSWAETEAGTCDAYGGTIVESSGAATPTTTPESAIIILGGNSASYSGKVDLVNISQSSGPLCGESIPNLPNYQNYQSATVTSDGKLVLCGGSTPGATNSELCYYLADDNVWQPGPSLPSGRRVGYMVTMDNYIVFLGGQGSTGFLDDIYKTEDTLSGSWSLMDKMETTRGYHCAVTTDSSVIITGGRGGTGDTLLSSVEEWSLDNSNFLMNPMNTAREAHGCLRFETNSEEMIIVAGGYPYIKSIEKMQRSRSGGSWSSWEIIGNLAHARWSFPMVQWNDGLLYIFGGKDNGCGCDSDKILSSENGTIWNTEDMTMPIGRQYHSAISTGQLCK